MMDPTSDFQMPSMPFALPGSAAPSSTGNVVAPKPMTVAPEPPAPPAMPAPVSSPMAGPLNMDSLLPMMGGEPSAMQYAVETQSDGTLLLRLKNPDGTMGPVVQHLAPPKLKSAPRK